MQATTDSLPALSDLKLVDEDRDVTIMWSGSPSSTRIYKQTESDIGTNVAGTIFDAGKLFGLIEEDNTVFLITSKMINDYWEQHNYGSSDGYSRVRGPDYRDNFAGYALGRIEDMETTDMDRILASGWELKGDGKIRKRS